MLADATKTPRAPASNGCAGDTGRAGRRRGSKSQVVEPNVSAPARRLHPADRDLHNALAVEARRASSISTKKN
jgi:hypothetical protein